MLLFVRVGVGDNIVRIKPDFHSDDLNSKLFAQDLHNNLGRNLSSIKERMSNETVNAETIKLVEKAIIDLRLVSRNLMPSELAFVGLAKTHQQTIDSLQSSSKISFT